MHQDQHDEMKEAIRKALASGDRTTLKMGEMTLHIGGHGPLSGNLEFDPVGVSSEDRDDFMRELEREMEEHPYPPLPPEEQGKGLERWLS